MAQPRRKQPLRACRHPVFFYFEPDLEELESEGETKEALVEKKRKRNEFRERATSRERAITSPEPVVVRTPSAQKMKKRMWGSLHPDLVESILSHLPVSSLWRTVMAIDPARWKQIVSNDGCTNILAHGDHVDSSIGYIKSYSSTFRSTFLPPEDDLRPPAPRVLDHATQKWQSLPRYPENDVRHRLKVQSVSEGLILMVMPEDAMIFARYSLGHDFRHRMVIWNPVSQSRRWLPRSPFEYNDPTLFNCLEVLVVDPSKTRYRVIEFVQSVREQATNPMLLGIRRHGRRHHVPRRPDQKAIAAYTVYDSESKTWGPIQPQPETIPEVRLNSSRTFVSCDGCVCFVRVQHQSTGWPGWEQPVAVVCFDLSTNTWSEVTFPAKFFDKLPGGHTGCLVQSMLYACGKVYLICTRSPKAQLYTHYIVSISLGDIQFGVAAFELVGRAREAPGRTAKSTSFYAKHPAPKCWQSKPNELILPRLCARACIHRWYMLPVGRTFHLCVVVCGRWHRRFDLYAGVWTDLLMEVPCEREHDQKVKTAPLPSRNLYYWDTKYHPYIPGWVQV